MDLPEHGANPHALYRRLGLAAPRNVTDFSENCNPAGPPAAVFEQWEQLYPAVARYPDPSGEPFLSAVSAYHGVAPQCVIPGNGAAELLALLAAQYTGKNAILIDPAFSEYEATLTAAGAHLIRIQAQEDDGFALPAAAIRRVLPEADVLYLCTPHNPTGRLPDADVLLGLLHSAGTAGCDVIVDEAFIDWVGEGHSVVGQLDRFPHVTVVRSMTKLYAIPGIRLGYAVAHPDRVAKLKQQAPHWNVNAVAARIGTICLAEETYRRTAIRHAADERRKMTAFLEGHGCKVLPSAANYLLFQPPARITARDVLQELLAQGIVVRHTENFKGLDGRWLRIGMKSRFDMERLRSALEGCFTKGELVFICGGVRSGKSAYAERLLLEKAGRAGGRLVYIASGTAGDAEMAERIARHRKDRAEDGWTTIEQPIDMERVLPQLAPGDQVLWDCATTWLANEAFAGWETGTPCIGEPGCIERKTDRLLATVDRMLGTVSRLVIVSNEVFDEPLHDEEWTRKYTQVLGSLHQQLAARARTAIEMDSGLAIIRKGDGSR